MPLWESSERLRERQPEIQRSTGKAKQELTVFDSERAFRAAHTVNRVRAAHSSSCIVRPYLPYLHLVFFFFAAPAFTLKQLLCDSRDRKVSHLPGRQETALLFAGHDRSRPFAWSPARTGAAQLLSQSVPRAHVTLLSLLFNSSWKHARGGGWPARWLAEQVRPLDAVVLERAYHFTWRATEATT